MCQGKRSQVGVQASAAGYVGDGGSAVATRARPATSTSADSAFTHPTSPPIGHAPPRTRRRDLPPAGLSIARRKA